MARSLTVEIMRLFLILLFVTGAARAHLGHDNQVEVRVFQDRMRLVFRTSLPHAWSLLGERAPLMADEAGKAVASPLLVAAAPTLIAISQAGETMTPVKAEAIFEPDEHVAFVLNFGRPVKWPVTVEVKWFPPGGQLDTTTFAVFDLTASPFARDIEPILTREIRSDRPTVTFGLDRGDADSAPVAGPDSPPADMAENPPRRMRKWFWLAGSAGVTLLLLAGWKWLSPKA